MASALTQDVATFSAGFLSQSLDSLMEEMKAIRTRSIEDLKFRNASRLQEQKDSAATGRAVAVQKQRGEDARNTANLESLREAGKDRKKRTANRAKERGKWAEAVIKGDLVPDRVPGLTHKKDGKWVDKSGTVVSTRDVALAYADYVMETDESKERARKNMAYQSLAVDLMRDEEDAFKMMGRLDPKDQYEVDKIVQRLKATAPKAKEPGLLTPRVPGGALTDSGKKALNSPSFMDAAAEGL